MNKRGIGPLIATVIIVGATVIIAGMVGVWLSDTFKTKINTEECSSKGRELCTNLITRITLTAIESDGITAARLSWIGDVNLIPQNIKVAFLDSNGLTQEIIDIIQSEWSNGIAFKEFNGVANTVEITPLYNPSSYVPGASCSEVPCPKISKEVISGTDGGQGQDLTGPIITHNPPTDIDAGADLLIRATITDAETGVKEAFVYYKTIGQPDYNLPPLTMTNPSGDDIYEATILGSEITYEGLEYYIEAKDNANAENTETTQTYRPTVYVTKTLTKTAIEDYITYDGYTTATVLYSGITGIWIGHVSFTGDIQRGFIDFNTDPIPDDAQIDQTELILTKLINFNPPNTRIDVKEMSQKAQDYAGANALWTAINSGILYIRYNIPDGPGGTSYTINLGTDANTDLQFRLGARWFSVGLQGSEVNGERTVFGSEEYLPEEEYRPKLRVRYHKS